MQQMPKKLVDAGKWLESVSHSWMYFNTVKKIISEAPTAEVYGQWIPMEERPPLVSDEYIVVIAGADKATCLYYDADEGVWFDENEGGKITYKVEKWMPLPPAADGQEERGRQ